MATRDEILALIKPTVYGWIEEALGTSDALSSNLAVVSGGASGPAGGDLDGTYPDPTVVGLQGRDVSSAAPSTSDALVWNGTAWAPGAVPISGAAGGDLSGTYPNPTVDGLQTRPVAATAPSTNQALVWNGSTWTPGSALPTGAAGGDLAGTYPNPTVDGIHGRAIASTAPSSGQIYYWDGSQWAVGAISNITGTITDAQHGSRGGGTLHAAATTTTRGFVELATDGETAANVVVQGNDSRLSNARTPTGTAGGDLAGTYPNPTVDGLQGRAVSASAPSTEDLLFWSGSAWTPAQIRTLGGGVHHYRRKGTAQVFGSGSYEEVTFPTAVTSINMSSLTVPVRGIYQIDAVVTIDAGTPVIVIDTRLALYINGSNAGLLDRYYSSEADEGFICLSGGMSIYLQASDVISIRYYNLFASDSETVADTAQNWVSVTLIPGGDV